MKTIVCFGDSNTYGYNPLTELRYPRDVRWTGRLQMLLGHEYRIIEEGCNGRTTVFEEPGAEWKSGLYAFKPCLNSHKPIDMIIMMLGSNDLKNYFHASAEDIAAGAEQLVGQIQEFLLDKQGFVPEILLVAPPVIGEGIIHTRFGNHFEADAVTRSQQFAKLYKEVAERKGTMYLNAADYVESSKADCLHLMPEAHAALAEAFCEKILGYRIRKSELRDLDRMMEIYAIARQAMIDNGNPNQWGKERPSRETIRQDIINGNSYVYEVDGSVEGAFTFIIGDDPTYAVIDEGEWPNDKTYGTIHRIASSGKAKGLFRIVVTFCESTIDELRIDTHKDNKIMQHLVTSCGYKYCGIIYLADGAERLAYHKSARRSLEHISYDTLVQYLLGKKTISLRKSHYQILGKRTRMTDDGYGRIPEAEIAFETGEGQTLYAFAYDATAYQEYGIVDKSWLDHDYNSGEVDKKEHCLESYDSLLESLDSDYSKLFLELKDMLEMADYYVDQEYDHACM